MQLQETSPEARDSNGGSHAPKSSHASGESEASAAETQRRAQRMLRSLCRRLLQSETVVRLHCRHQAERLGQRPPAVALRAAALHAGQALKTLPGQAAPEQLPRSVAGTLTGTVVSTFQEAIVDRFISSERAYRNTLLGLREGIDLVRVLEELARLQSEPALETWCERWLEARTPLVLDAEVGLKWFAQHSDQAAQTARPFKLRRRK